MYQTNVNISVLPSLSSFEVQIVSPKNTIMFSGWCGVGKEIILQRCTFFQQQPISQHFEPTTSLSCKYRNIIITIK
jgi:hypothetical protein